MFIFAIFASYSQRKIWSRTLFEAGKVAGSATYKQGKVPLKSVCLFSNENEDSLFICFTSSDQNVFPKTTKCPFKNNLAHVLPVWRRHHVEVGSVARAGLTCSRGQRRTTTGGWCMYALSL